MKHQMFVIVAILALLSSTKTSQGAPTKTSEACSRIADMLLENQLNALRESPTANAESERSLKKAFLQFCEGKLVRTESVMTYDNGRPIYQNGRWHRPDGSEQRLNIFELAAQNAAILEPFLEAHRACAPGCGYVSWGIWGDEAHQARRSCHNSGEAIDIHAITCGGTHVAMSSRFNSYVSCMRGHLGVIYNRGRGDHQDHAHFELHNCNMCAGLGCGGGRRSEDRGSGRGVRGGSSDSSDSKDDSDSADESDDNSNNEDSGGEEN